MADQLPPPYGIRTTRCRVHPARFRWNILERGKPVQSSEESYATRHEAEAAARVEMEKFTRLGESADKG
jgi:hypothetical protein